MIRFLIAAFFFYSDGVLADINVDEDMVVESYTSTVKVSGVYLMGAQYPGKPNFDSLYVKIPKSNESVLCVKLSSVDGNYKALLTYSLNGDEIGWEKINFSSKFEGEIAKLKYNEVAVLSSIGSGCMAGSSKIIMSSWASDPSKVTPIFLVRSDARRDDVYSPSIDQEKFSTRCEEIDSQKKVTYDKSCELKGFNFSELNKFEFKRKHFRPITKEAVEIYN